MALFGAQIGCTPARAPAPSVPEPALPDPRGDSLRTVVEALPSAASFSYEPGAHQYEVLTESEIHQPGDPAGARASVRTFARVTVRMDSATPDSLAVVVTLDSVHAERDAIIPPPDSGLAHVDSALSNPAFSTTIDLQGLALSAIEQPRECATRSDATELLAAARELLVRVPRALEVGAAWSDTSTVSICRGGVPVSTGVVRTFEVREPRRDADGALLFRVAQRTTFSLAGTQTTEYGQVIALSGGGESQAILELDVAAGLTRSAEREGTSDVTVTYGRTSTQFTQRVRQTVRLLPPR